MSPSQPGRDDGMMQFVQKVLYVLAALVLILVDLLVGVVFLLGSFQGEYGSFAGIVGFLMVAAVPVLGVLVNYQKKSRIVVCASCGWRGTLRRWEDGVEWTETDRTGGTKKTKQSSGCPQCQSDVYIEETPKQPFNWRKAYLFVAGVAGGIALLVLLVLAFDTPPGENGQPVLRGHQRHPGR